MFSFTIGTVLALILAILARTIKFDHDRGFYATVLIVIATYYVLFAFVSGKAIYTEIILATIFSIIAIIGAVKYPVIIGLGIFLHGIFDFIHPLIIFNPGVPDWWPPFCAGIDIVLGIWAMYLARSGKGLVSLGRAT